ncbi:DUF6984 family protein [Pseudarthrobacter chlorophenolicus]|uniref:DUF6984 family protein n=1 Tax=Pseudarthrobacter chlorophenolicus TaxID=85085 RepID=UPI000697E932|nr:hypothetical protein [Pseudarthrobacter chlorophenolicus]
MTLRPLLPGEIVIVQALLERTGQPRWNALDLSALLVSDTNDGGMGSLQFHSSKPDREYGRTLAEGWFKDSDNFPVQVALNLDTDDDVYELDSWRVDFSPRRRLPKTKADIVSDPAELA